MTIDSPRQSYTSRGPTIPTEYSDTNEWLRAISVYLQGQYQSRVAILPQFAAIDAADWGPAITAAVNSLPDGGTILVPSASRNYVVSSTVTTGATINWLFEGGILEVTGSLTINGGVASVNHHSQCFKVDAATASQSKLKIRNVAAAGSVAAGASVSPYVWRISPMWFDGASMSHKIQKVFQVGGAKTVCSVPAGVYRITSTIDLDETDYGSHLVLEGDSYLATTLEMAAGAAICGVDCSGADECEIRNLRIIEGSGSQTCVCFGLGGTSLKVRDCWAGNALYGFYQNRGSGTRLTNNFVEACVSGYFIGPNNDLTGSITGIPAPSGGVTDLHWTGGLIFNCDVGVSILKAGSNIIRGFNMTAATISNSDNHNVLMLDTSSSNGCRAAVFSAVVIKGAQGGTTVDAGVRVSNMKATFMGCTIVENVNTGIIAEDTSTILTMGCFFGNFTGTAQTANTAAGSGSPSITEVNSIAA